MTRLVVWLSCILFAAAVAAAPPVLIGTPHGEISDVAVWPDARRPVVLTAAGSDGLLAYSAAGDVLAAVPDVVASFVDVIGPWIVVTNAVDATLRLYELDPVQHTFRAVHARPIPVEDQVTGLCHHRSSASQADYVFVLTDAGLLRQWQLVSSGDAVEARFVRDVPLGKGVAHCDVDERTGVLFAADEGLGIWQIDGEPETDPVRTPFVLAEPWGDLADEPKGLTVIDEPGIEPALIVAEGEGGRFASFRLADGSLVRRTRIDAVHGAEGIAWLGPDRLVVADEDTERIVIASFDRSLLPKSQRDSQARTNPPVVIADVETEIASSYGDAADDAAIWIDRADPARSLVIATQKQRGLQVFDLAGRTVQVLADGRMNNVDLRDGFELGGRTVSLVAATNRTDDSLALYAIDAESRSLTNVAAGTIGTGLVDPYGTCLYRGRHALYAFVNDSVDGRVRQFRLADNGAGRVTAELVREFVVGSQAEGCAVDDALGHLYVAEEDRGLWKYSALPDAGNTRTLIDSVDRRLDADVEGVAIYDAGSGTGYLVVSNQGNDDFVVYRREGDNAYVGRFRIVADPRSGIDGVSETDGLDVTSAALGAAFPNGLIVVQDGRNLAPPERQNFKLVSWERVARALGLAPYTKP